MSVKYGEKSNLVTENNEEFVTGIEKDKVKDTNQEKIERKNSKKSIVVLGVGSKTEKGMRSK